MWQIVIVTPVCNRNCTVWQIVIVTPVRNRNCALCDSSVLWLQCVIMSLYCVTDCHCDSRSTDWCSWQQIPRAAALHLRHPRRGLLLLCHSFTVPTYGTFIIMYNQSFIQNVNLRRVSSTEFSVAPVRSQLLEKPWLSRVELCSTNVTAFQFGQKIVAHITIIIIIIIIRKFITRTCSQALSLNRRRGQLLGGETECVNCLWLSWAIKWDCGAWSYIRTNSF